MWKNNERGQDVIEFALVMPFLLMFLFGIAYIGFLFSDYLTLNNLARSSAREASITAQQSYGDGKNTAPIQAAYNQVQKKYVEQAEKSQHMYEITDGDYTIRPVMEGGQVHDVRVTITARMKDDNSAIHAIKNFIPESVREFQIQYQMLQEGYLQQEQ